MRTHLSQTKYSHTKEEFCGACLAVPMALVGAGAAGIGIKGNHSKTKKILLWSGIAITLISVIIGVIFLLSGCKNCR